MEKFGVYKLSTVLGTRLRDKADTFREAHEKMERLSWENRSGMFIIKPL
jgi:hypothetical protein